jgi:hypothetical protein
MVELKDSAAALSNAEPTRPIDCSTPRRPQAVAYASEVYSLPRSELNRIRFNEVVRD